MVKIEKRPIINAKISVLFLFFKEYAINTGITGSTQGENTETIPAKNENRGMIFILNLQIHHVI